MSMNAPILRARVGDNTIRDGGQGAKGTVKALGEVMLRHSPGLIAATSEAGITDFDAMSLASSRFAPSMKMGPEYIEATRFLLRERLPGVAINLQGLITGPSPFFFQKAEELYDGGILTSFAYPQSHDAAFLAGNGTYKIPGRDQNITTPDEIARYRDHILAGTRANAIAIDEFAARLKAPFHRYWSRADGWREAPKDEDDDGIRVSNVDEFAAEVRQIELREGCRHIPSSTEALMNPDQFKQVMAATIHSTRGKVSEVGLHLHVLADISEEDEIGLIQTAIRVILEYNQLCPESPITDVVVECSLLKEWGGCVTLKKRHGNALIDNAIIALQGMRSEGVEFMNDIHWPNLRKAQSQAMQWRSELEACDRRQQVA